MLIDPTIVLVVQSGLSYAVLVLLVRWFVAPYLATQPVRKTMLLLLTPHICHHVGLVMLVPGVVGIGIPPEFARIVAVGEVTILFLAMLCMGALRNGSVRAPLFLWVFTVAGFVYTFDADWVALREGAARINFNPHWYVAVLYVPLLFVSHVLVLINLLRRGHEFRDLNDQRLPQPSVAGVSTAR